MSDPRERFLLRDSGRRSRSGLVLMLGVHVGVLVLIVFYVVRSLALDGRVPWFQAGVGLVLVLIVVRISCKVPSMWHGPVLLAADEHGVRLPGLVPWTDVTALRIGPVPPLPEYDAAAHGSVAPEVEDFARRFGARPPLPPRGDVLVSVALVARSAAVRTEVDRVRRRIESEVSGATFPWKSRDLDALVRRIEEWAAHWPQCPQPAGFHVAVASDELDHDRFVQVVRQYRPDLVPGTTVALPPGSYDSPHRAAARLARVVEGLTSYPT